MGFLQPLALLGLAAAGIPPLLHLLQRRTPPTVIFPAVRYLSETERRHSRRLRLRNLLLMLLRMLVIALIVMALARPLARLPMGDVHGPSALAVVIDNSLSSGAVVAGRRTVDLLADRARAAVARVRSGDRLWLVLADGVPRRVERSQALLLLDSLAPTPVRLDLGEAVRVAARLVADDPLPGEVLVVSDLQQSALSSGVEPEVPVLFVAPPDLPANVAVDSVTLTPAVWSPNGTAIVSLGGTGAQAGEVRIELEGVVVARGLAAPGDQAALAVEPPGSGWYRARVLVGPDELRADDVLHVAVRAAAPTSATAGAGAGTFVTQGIDVLQEAGRIARGADVTLGDRLTAGTEILFPPAEAALIGGVNRALQARGVAWRIGDIVQGEWAVSGDVAGSEEARVFRRHRLDGTGSVIARAGNDPWIVRDGDVVIVGSRLEADWTTLPVSAGFVPFLDGMVNRVAGRGATRVAAVPGGAVRLPPEVTTFLGPSGRVAVSGERLVQAPSTPGAYFLLGAAGDTIGALEVNPDPRESDLRSADRAGLRATFGRRAELVAADRVANAIFRTARRADLTGWFVGLAIILALIELVVASLGGRRTGET